MNVWYIPDGQYSTLFYFKCAKQFWEGYNVRDFQNKLSARIIYRQN